ncbi:MAG TPA: phosphate ABC transporter substrate-binding protein [Firmicutes bacterium]|nr:phosphate ABC transporter substrate-binding protein [Bacillota bacterium]
MKKLASLLCAAALTTVMFAGCSGGEVGGTSEPQSNGGDTSPALSGDLKFAGSSSMADVMAALTEEFKSLHPDVTTTVDQQGSGSAITGLNDGTCQVGNLSRAVKDEENPDGEYEVITMAIDGIAVVVNPANGVEDLTLEQIASIFKGEINNWSEVGGADSEIMVVGREESSGTRDGFEEIAGVKGECKYDVQQKETGDVVSSVASNEQAIGYISYASVNDQVKALKVGGVEVSDPTIEDGTYAFQRPFVHAYRAGTDDELVNAYIEFLKTDAAQEIIAGEKLIPVKFWEE